MAAQQPASFLGRVKSTRTAPSSTRTQTLHASAATTAASKSLPTTVTSGVSHLALFLTNLRLLDLDLRPDWPAISPQTFTAREATQGQKKRIQCVEWALFQLFAIWDPDETRSKLQPFFPPVDQVQSLNLRAALLRCLEQAKKNGILGRDAVVRKTMLDECKGERLEEVLAVVSSAVLKQVTAVRTAEEAEYPALAQTYALENRGYKGERPQVNFLDLAHRASLSNLLHRKAAAREQFRDFAELLSVKERSIARRHEQIRAEEQEQNGEESVSNDAKLDVWRTVRNNWTGNERWMETLLYGDAHAQRDGLLSTPFDRVWRRVQTGRLSELEDDHIGGLLEQLDGRVRLQQERLEKWQDFHRRMSGEASSLSQEKILESQKRRKGIDLSFGVHESFHLGRMSPRKMPVQRRPPLDEEYSRLVEDFQQELSRASQRQPVDLSGLLPSRSARLASGHDSLAVLPPTEEPISEMSDLEDDPPVERPEDIKAKSRGAQEEMPNAVASKTEINGPPIRPSTEEQSNGIDIETPRPSRRSPSKSSRQLQTSPTRSPTRAATVAPEPRSPERSPARRPRPAPTMLPPDIAPQTPTSPTQVLADQILASMDNASPSPIKQPKPRHTLSLAERTRLSMARTSHAKYYLADEDEDQDQVADSLPAKRTPTVTVSESETNDREGGEYEDLVARTRRSMAGFEAAKQKAQLERRRSLRKSKMAPRREGSYFPSVEEEGAPDASMLAEELMGEDEDYEAVFKSRPRIKLSPVPTPTKTWDLGEYD